MMQALFQKIENCRQEIDGIRINMKVVDTNDNYVIGIVTPLMLRVHERVVQSGEIVFIGMWNNNMNIFLSIFIRKE